MDATITISVIVGIGIGFGILTIMVCRRERPGQLRTLYRGTPPASPPPPSGLPPGGKPRPPAPPR